MSLRHPSQSRSRPAYDPPRIRSMGTDELLEVVGPVQGYGGITGLGGGLGADGRGTGDLFQLDRN